MARGLLTAFLRRAAGDRLVAGHPVHQLAEDESQAEAVQDGVLEGGVQVHGVVMPPALFADVEHTGPPQVSDDSPDRAPGQGHRLRDLLYCALRVDSDVEQDGAVAGNEIPVVFDGHINSTAILVF